MSQSSRDLGLEVLALVAHVEWARRRSAGWRGWCSWRRACRACRGAGAGPRVSGVAPPAGSRRRAGRRSPRGDRRSKGRFIRSSSGRCLGRSSAARRSMFAPTSWPICSPSDVLILARVPLKLPQRLLADAGLAAASPATPGATRPAGRTEARAWPGGPSRAGSRGWSSAPGWSNRAASAASARGSCSRPVIIDSNNWRSCSGVILRSICSSICASFSRSCCDIPPPGWLGIGGGPAPKKSGNSRSNSGMSWDSLTSVARMAARKKSRSAMPVASIARSASALSATEMRTPAARSAVINSTIRSSIGMSLS